MNKPELDITDVVIKFKTRNRYNRSEIKFGKSRTNHNRNRYNTV